MESIEKKRKKKKLYLSLILNALMCISQLSILFLYWNNLDPLMIFGCSGIAFGTGLRALVSYLELMDEIYQR
jgi:hypothetical protein